MSVAEGHKVEVLCWFINDDLEKIFSVEMKSTQTVAALRSRIKEDNPQKLSRFDARSLTLWKVRPSRLSRGTLPVLLTENLGRYKSQRCESELASVSGDQGRSESLHETSPMETHRRGLALTART